MLNKAILIGRLTRDPELRYTNTNNIPVCSFTIAVDRRFARQGEEKQTDFIPIVAWNKSAEFCSKYFTKGMQVAVCGRIQTRSWDDAEGKKRYVTEVVADEVHFADSKRSNREGQPVTESNEEVEGFYPLESEDDLPF